MAGGYATISKPRQRPDNDDLRKARWTALPAVAFSSGSPIDTRAHRSYGRKTLPISPGGGNGEPVEPMRIAQSLRAQRLGDRSGHQAIADVESCQSINLGRCGRQCNCRHCRDADGQAPPTISISCGNLELSGPGPVIAP